MDVVGVGLNATDTVIPVPQYPVAGSKVEIHSAGVMLGGQVATAMVACRHWGLSARYIGKLGDDHAASLHRADFERRGVEAHLLTAAGCPSQQSFILLEESGERTVLWKRDERLAIQPAELERSWITDARALHIDGQDTAAALTAATWAREAGVPVVADIDNLYAGVMPLLEKIDYLIVSKNIPEDLTGEKDLQQALKKMQQQLGCKLAAATLGQDGVLGYDGAEFCYAPAFAVGPVDTTGAGDIFHAGFIYGLLQGWPLKQQLEFGCAAAALNCKAMGARGGIEDVARIQELIAIGKRHAAFKF